VQSMTGFGRAGVAVASRRLSVEVRSTNHRGLDVKVRGRELDAACELEIHRCVRAAVERGSVAVTVHDEAETTGALDRDGLRILHGELEGLRQELGLAEPVGMTALAAFAQALASGGRARPPDELWAALRPALEAALAGLAETRAREGRALALDIGRRLATLGGLVEQLGARSQGLAAKAAGRLEQRLGALVAGGVDAGRLAQEIALLADRLDVTEELTRLGTHLEHLAELARPDRPGAVGRRIDFLIQEVGRELNTIGSKAQDAEVAALVIDAKAELEKIREQAQNVE
jgi:uncharacterized protein (TIGR00255 family)